LVTNGATRSFSRCDSNDETNDFAHRRHAKRCASPRNGHTADSGQEGIQAFSAAEKRGEPFAVVITDLVMPHVDGRKVAAAVKAASPTTPEILLTGWGQRLMAQNDVPPHVDRVLNKPPRLHELRPALAELTANAGPIKLP